MLIQNLSTDAKLTVVSGVTSAGTGNVDTSLVDMAGFDGVLLVFLLGTATDTAVVTAKAQQGEASNGSDQADVTGASCSVTDAGGASSNKALIVDVVRPQKRYVRGRLGRATANCGVSAVVAIQYNARSKPTTQHASILAQALAAGA